MSDAYLNPNIVQATKIAEYQPFENNSKTLPILVFNNVA